MKTAMYLAIMIAVAVIEATFPNANWVTNTLLVCAGFFATLKAIIHMGDK